MDSGKADTMNEEQEVEASGPGNFKFRARGYDIMTLLVVAGLAVMGYAMFEMKSTNERIAVAISGLTEAQREMACVISLPMDERLRQIGDPNSFCKRMARMHSA